MKKLLLTTGMIVAMFSQVKAFDENFNTNPLTNGHWVYGAGGNSFDQYTWSSGDLAVHVDSSLPTTRIQSSLGLTLTQSTSFTMKVQFSLENVVAPSDQYQAFGFGLVSSLSTGSDRTGSFSDYASDNSFNMVEWNYWPNVTPYGGPTLSPTVFGSHKPGNDGFGNFASIFGSGADLGDNLTGVKELPLGRLEADISYNATTTELILAMFSVGAGGTLTPLVTQTPSIHLNANEGYSSYDTSYGFSVDSFAVSSWNDGYTTSNAPSLQGDVHFYSVRVSQVPEPTAVLSILVGLGVLLTLGRRAK